MKPDRPQRNVQHVGKMWFNYGMTLTAKSLGIIDASARLLQRSTRLQIRNQILRDQSTVLLQKSGRNDRRRNLVIGS